MEAKKDLLAYCREAQAEMRLGAASQLKQAMWGRTRVLKKQFGSMGVTRDPNSETGTWEQGQP